MNPTDGNGSPFPCSSCGHTHTQVINSRPVGGTIRRRRNCPHCGHRMTTREYEVEKIGGNDRSPRYRESGRWTGAWSHWGIIA
jgi:DNA-directed RNA polymerase subunit RPC12/RpoP